MTSDFDPPVIVQRRISSGALDRTQTTVSTHGKHRPSTEEEEFRWRFGYEPPPGEMELQILGQYNCALSGKILLQGKMYVTNACVAFFSVFNDSTFLSLIPTLVLFEYPEIASMRKRSNALIFNNSIEFTLKDATKYFFTSYVNREKAFNLVARALHRAKLTGSSADLDDREEDALLSEALGNDGSITLSSLNNHCPQSAVPVPSEVFGVMSHDYPTADEIKSNREVVGLLPQGADLGLNAEYEEYQLPNKRVLESAVPLCVLQETLEQVYKTIIADLRFEQILAVLSGYVDFTPTRFIPARDWTSIKDEGAVSFKKYNFRKKLEQRSSFVRLPDAVTCEEHVCLYVNKSKSQFVKDSIVINSGVPMSSSFLLHCRIIASRISQEVTQIDADMDIIWLKNPIFKGQVKSSVESGWFTTNTLVRHALTETCLKKRPVFHGGSATPCFDPVTTTFDTGRGIAICGKRRCLAYDFSGSIPSCQTVILAASLILNACLLFFLVSSLSTRIPFGQHA